MKKINRPKMEPKMESLQLMIETFSLPMEILNRQITTILIASGPCLKHAISYLMMRSSPKQSLTEHWLSNALCNK